MDKVTEKTFCSAKGIVITLKPVSQFKLDAIRSSNEEIPVPTYQVKVVGGDTFDYPLDEEIAKNKGRLDEWLAYLSAKKAADAKASKRFADLLFYEGTDIEVPPEDSDWQKTSEHFGIKIPTDPIDRKLHYIYNELLVSAEEIPALISQILSVSQIDEEAVTKIRNSFRPKAQRDTNSAEGKNKGKVANSKSNV